MPRYEVQSKVDDLSGYDHRVEVTHIPLVGRSIYGDPEFNWSAPQSAPQKRSYAFCMHSLPSTARIVMHRIFIQGFDMLEDHATNYFSVSNCYYIGRHDGVKHYQPLSIEAVSIPSDPQRYWHNFSSNDPDTYRVVGYNSRNYAENVYKAPYTYSCMHYQYMSLNERLQLDSLGTADNLRLVFVVTGVNSLPERPLIFTSNVEYFV